MSQPQTSIYGPLIDIAENAVRHWAGDVDRAEAGRVLDKWKFAAALSQRERAAVLDRFDADPDPVAYRDYLPDLAHGGVS